MKKTFLAFGIVTALLGTSSAMAADVMSAPVSHDWTGFYAGVNGGLGFGQNNWNAPSLGFTSPSGNFSGMLGGVTVGANWQSSAWVYGLEGDMDVAGLLSSDPASVVFTCGVSCNTAVGSLGTLRVRIGHELGTRAMVYATGGLAGGWVHAYDPLVLGGADLGSATQIGWTAGGGIEAAMSDHISVKAEALYVGLGSLPISNCFAGCTTNVNFAVARVGLNYKF
jgi:outer membrane immunogenic protein